MILINILPYFCRKLGKMSQNLSSASVVIGALRVKWKLFCIILVKTVWCRGGGSSVEEKWGICRERGSKPFFKEPMVTVGPLDMQ